MPDSINTPNASVHSLEKLRAILERITERVRADGSAALSTALSETTAAFTKFFQEVGDPDFSPKLLASGDIPNSEVYNSNIRAIYNDLKRFHGELIALANSQLQAFNYAQVVNDEIVKRADKLASTVLDLNILAGFTRGDVIVAGDDFRSMDFIDMSAPVASERAERMNGGAGLSLFRNGTQSALTPDTEVEIFPLSIAARKRTVDSQNSSSRVNTEPTPNNVERFYEGNYYNFLGQARPEGGQFHIKFVADPSKLGGGSKSEQPQNLGTRTIEQAVGERFNPKEQSEDLGFYVDIGGSETEKKRFRLQMIDGNPDTFWECEYVVSVPPLLDNLFDDSSVEDQEGGNSKTGPRGAVVNIDIREAEKAAEAADDKKDLDLAIEIVLILKEPKPVNFILLNPVIFGSNAHISVDDIATAESVDGAFKTVDGWLLNKFAKTITPEANEFLTDSQLSQTLAPSRYSYTGLGIFPFPVRTTRKIKIGISVENPVPNLYERYYISLKNQVEVITETKTTTKKGIFR